jgi:hypothetical protein
MEDLFERAAADGVVVPPRSLLETALRNLLNQRSSLERAVRTAGSTLDNNPAENALPPLKLGAKNWLFVGHQDAGTRLANLFTVLENCRQAGVNAEAYLGDLLTALASASVREVKEWFPSAWKARRAAGITA